MDKRSVASRQSVGVWLTVLGLMVCVMVLIGVDSRPPIAPSLELKSTRPAATRPTGVPPIDRPSEEVVVPTTRSAASSPGIRVNVTPGGDISLTLQIRGPYSIRALGTTSVLQTGKSLAPTTVQSTATGLKIGDSTFQANRLEIIPKQNPAVRVNDHLYRGTLRLFRRDDGRVSAVNVLPVEEYLASVVDSEMPAAFPVSARQAQAIVSRTYALYQMKRAGPATVYDLFSSQRSQKYLGVEYNQSGRRLAGESESSRNAVAQTRGIVCTQRGEIFCTYYSATCGGRTTSGSEFYSDATLLKSVPCEWCGDSQSYRWTAQSSRRDFLRKLQPLGAFSDATTIRQTAGPGKGVLSRFRLIDGKTSLEVTGTQLRECLAVRSPHFTLTMDNDQVRVEGRGHGHGVGFCQWGARGQALEGKTAHAIVLHYYPGAQLMTVDD